MESQDIGTSTIWPVIFCLTFYIFISPRAIFLLAVIVLLNVQEGLTACTDVHYMHTCKPAHQGHKHVPNALKWETQVLHRNSTCSRLLSHLFSPMYHSFDIGIIKHTL